MFACPARAASWRTLTPLLANRVMKEFASLQASLPPGYLIELSGITAEAKKSNDALLPVFPVMIALMLLVIVVQVRSL